MKIKELDYIETRSGKKGTVVLIHTYPKLAYEVEFAGERDTRAVEPEDILRVIESY